MSRWSRRHQTRFSTKPPRRSRRLSRDLYTFFRSSTSYRLRIALAYKQLEYTPHYVSLPKMEQRAPSYRALHAQGLVPLLIDGESIFHSVHGHHRVSGRGLPGATADAGERAWTPLRAGGVPNHRLRYSSSQQRARTQAHPDAIRCRRGSDQDVVSPLDR